MHFLLELTQPWAYVLVGALAAAEASAFVGLVIPGEAAMLFGGVLAFQGRAELWVMVVVACIGAVVGDSAGYEIGRHLGPRLQSSALGRRIGRDRWERANAYVRRQGGRAVFFGRFVGVLRALVPAIAGQARLPYKTFLPFNIAGGVTWATGFVLLGYLAGGSWRLVERWAGRASLVLAGLVAVAAAVVFAARWTAANLDELRRRRDRVLERPRVARVRARFRNQIDFIRRRFDPSQRFGLSLTIGLVLCVAGVWAFGAILQDVIGRDELALFDRPILRFLVTHRDGVLTVAMKAVTLLGGSRVVIAVTLIAMVWAYLRTTDARWLLFFATTLVGALVLDDVVKVLVDRPRPQLHPLVHAPGFSFPSGHATAAAATYAALAYVLTRNRSWAVSVWIWTAAGCVAAIVGFSRVYLGVHWPTDVLGGLTLGGLWTAVTATATSAFFGRRVARRE
jgi:membrane protein DedA with SNARE-associated domain/membrane-associated phospholipid phosphatase